jgi:hypothetical protein
VEFRPTPFKRRLLLNEAEHANTFAGMDAILNEKEVLTRCGRIQVPVLWKQSPATQKFPIDLPEKSAAIYRYRKLARNESCLSSGLQHDG